MIGDTAIVQAATTFVIDVMAEERSDEQAAP